MTYEEHAMVVVDGSDRWMVYGFAYDVADHHVVFVCHDVHGNARMIDPREFERVS